MSKKITDSTKFTRGRQVIRQLIAQYRVSSEQSDSSQKLYVAAIKALTTFAYSNFVASLIAKAPKNFSELSNQEFKDIAGAFAIDFDYFLNKY